MSIFIYDNINAKYILCIYNQFIFNIIIYIKIMIVIMIGFNLYNNKIHQSLYKYIMVGNIRGYNIHDNNCNC